MVEFSPERRYVEDAGIVLTGLGLPPAYGKVLGWLLICDPPYATATEIAEMTGLSKGSVSTGIRMLESTGLVRKVANPGRRGIAWELMPDAFTRVAESERFRLFRQLMDRGIELLGGEQSPLTDRLVYTRDLYAFVERELPGFIERFKTEHARKMARPEAGDR
ncbi:GbsR/MarR family transcriptional regulator [Micromonospora sp. NBC_01796]|uniref:GbsR/MarR family transcriptional regulator n=1 Tax=Micromonospora sp. NBC_01796 TaxID=2975987 RepID=UPI002DDB2862|nr:MarR family transcriptional regulator [Micromonospora sp. NBC_01796]WSA83184.1 MarR family transcriptional regulator [Micromonospora sp. NBC_01796]